MHPADLDWLRLYQDVIIILYSHLQMLDSLSIRSKNKHCQLKIALNQQIWCITGTTDSTDLVQMMMPCTLRLYFLGSRAVDNFLSFGVLITAPAVAMGSGGHAPWKNFEILGCLRCINSDAF